MSNHIVWKLYYYSIRVCKDYATTQKNTWCSIFTFQSSKESEFRAAFGRNQHTFKNRSMRLDMFRKALIWGTVFRTKLYIYTLTVGFKVVAF